MTLYCHRCGTGLPAGARFCSNCGTAMYMAAPVGRPLERPIVGRQLAGVCAALAQANAWDVAVVRIVTVIAFFCSGGIVSVAYVAGWIGIPEEIMPYPGSVAPPHSHL